MKPFNVCCKKQKKKRNSKNNTIDMIIRNNLKKNSPPLHSLWPAVRYTVQSSICVYIQQWNETTDTTMLLLYGCCMQHKWSWCCYYCLCYCCWRSSHWVLFLPLVVVNVVWTKIIIVFAVVRYKLLSVKQQ